MGPYKQRLKWETTEKSTSFLWDVSGIYESMTNKNLSFRVDFKKFLKQKYAVRIKYSHDQEAMISAKESLEIFPNKVLFIY